MKIKILTLLILILPLISNGQNLSLLDSQLSEVLKKDQEPRVGLQNAIKNNDVDSIVYYNTLMDQVDIDNQKIVFDMLDEYGWVNQLAEDSHRAIFLVIDHADLEYQKKYAPLIKEKSESGIIAKDKYATLLDRILMREGKRQMYGTQTYMKMVNEEKITYVWPVEDEHNVDSLRQSIGLIPLEIYVKVVQSAIGGQVLWDRSLDVDFFK